MPVETKAPANSWEPAPTRPPEFVNKRDVLGMGSFLKDREVPREKWGELIPRMISALDRKRHMELPTYRMGYEAASEAGPFMRAVVNTGDSTFGKVTETLLNWISPSDLGSAQDPNFLTKIKLVRQGVRDAISEGKTTAKTGMGRFIQNTLPAILPDMPAFTLLHNVNPSITLGALNSAGQMSDMLNKRQQSFDKKSLVKAMLLGQVFKHFPVPKLLKTPTGGALARIGKRVAGSGVVAAPASLISPAVELMDPTTSEKWSLEEFGKTWATFVALDIGRLVKAGQMGRIRSRVIEYGLTPKQADVFADGVAKDPRATIRKIQSDLMKNKAGIRNAAVAWKAWQAESGFEQAVATQKATVTPNEYITKGLMRQAGLREGPRAAAYKKAAAKMQQFQGDASLATRAELQTALGIKNPKSHVVTYVRRIQKQAMKPPDVEVPVEGETGVVPAEPAAEVSQFREPTLARYATPQDRYIYTLGLQDLLKPSERAKTKMELERQELFQRIDVTEKDYMEKANVPLKERVSSKFRNMPTKAHVQMWEWLDTPNFKPSTIKNIETRETYRQLRGWTDQFLKRTNEVRAHVGLEPIKKLEGYVRYIYDLHTQKDIEAKHPFPPDVEHWMKTVRPKHIFNPTAEARTADNKAGLLKDPFKAIKAMAASDLKQIYLEKPNLMFREEMNRLTEAKQIPESTRRWAEDWMDVMIKGYPSPVDQITNKTLEALKVPQIMGTLMRPFGKLWGPNSAQNIARGMGRAIHDATIWGRVKLVTRNHTQKFLPLGLYDTPSFLKGFLPESAELTEWIDESEFYQASRRNFLEDMPEGALAKLERIGFAPYAHSHAGRVGGNVPFTMKVAYHAAKGWAKHKNPQIAEFWQNPENVKREMDFGANTSQYWYNLLGMPELYRHRSLGLLAKLQSWSMNYVFKYWREMLHRLVKGRPAWAGEGPAVLPASARAGALRHIMASIAFIGGLKEGLGLDYKQVALLGVLPSYLSPVGQVSLGLVLLSAAKDERQKTVAKNILKKSWKAFLPGSGAWKDVAAVWEGDKPLKYLFFHTVKDD